jgi:Protein of unknown function (DUF3617)
MTPKQAVCSAALAGAAAFAQAQSQAPGLWEHTMQVQLPGAARPGAQGTTLKVCVTKEQAARPAEPRLAGDCTNTDVQRSGNTIKFKYECTRPRASSGEGEWTFVSDKAYTGKLATLNEVRGKPQTMRVEMRGKWLAADCGNVKPRPAPTRAP